MVMAVQYFVDIHVIRDVIGPIAAKLWPDEAPLDDEELVAHLKALTKEVVEDLAFEDRARVEIAQGWLMEGREQFRHQFFGPRKSIKYVKMRLMTATLTNPLNMMAVFGGEFRYAVDCLFAAMKKKAGEADVSSRGDLFGRVFSAGDGDGDSSLEGELNDYLTIVGFEPGTETPLDDPTAAFGFEAFRFWNDPVNVARFPAIAVVARGLYFIPATSVSVEGMFSLATKLMRNDRRKMMPGTLERHLLLGANKGYLDEATARLLNGAMADDDCDWIDDDDFLVGMS
jgi:hypothetical protein